MFSAFLSFLSGTAFRAIWGELSHWINGQQDHKHEVERIKLQETIDQSNHQRQMEMIRLQSDLQVKTIQVQGDIELEKIAADEHRIAVKSISMKSGNKFIDTWNQGIRPAGATIALIGAILECIALGLVPQETRDVFLMFLGLFVADRSLGHRGK